ncbi:hypothetical protein M2161_003897 [Streptomyces sp. SAI-133]|nr:hypothetical protein [Streptomyces sp. SAI-133]
MGHARRRAHLGQLRLVGHAFGQGAGLLGQQIRGGQFLAQPAHRDAARVVHRDQYGRTRDAGRDPAQRDSDVTEGGAGRRRGVDLAYETGCPYGTSGGVRDEMDLDPGPAE